MFYGITSLSLSITLFCVLLLLFSAVKHYVKNCLISPEAWILFLGLIYGIVGRYTDWQWHPKLTLKPDIVLMLFLPLLIFSSGRMIKPNALKSEVIPIGFFAIIGVIVTTFIIGFPISYILGIPLIHGLVLGAANGATDPAAVGAIFKNLKLPDRLNVLIEGESLFNDGVTVVLFTLISGLALGKVTFDPVYSAIEFIWAILAAIPIGITAGWLAAKLLCHWCEEQSFFTASMSIILAYGVFLITENIFHASGVISVLMAAIVFSKLWSIGEADKEKNRKARIMGAFWDYISQTLNAFLFFILGAMTGAHDFSGLSFYIIIAAIFSLILSRFVIVYGGCLVLRLLGNRLFLVSWQHVLFLGGLRGGISAALVLLIPHDYAYQQLFLCLAFTMIAFTLIIQPPLLSSYLRKTRLS